MEITQDSLDVCILIPCYNNLSGLIKSLKSVNYKKNKFLVVIVDDGSDIKLKYHDIYDILGDDLPLHIINLQRNSGITIALNNGLNWIENNLNATYIARLDCGDTCHPDRFYKQIDFLQKNPAIGMLGSWCTFQNPSTLQSYNYITPLKHDDIAREMHLRNVFIHPTVIFKTTLLIKIGYYPKEYTYVEDYAFFWTILKETKVAVLGETLVTCEINTKGISISQRKNQIYSRIKVINNFYTSTLLKTISQLKLYSLLVVPYSLILKAKYLTKK